MKAIEFANESRFAEVFSCLGGEFGQLFWWIDTQASPFDYIARSDAPTIEAEWDELDQRVGLSNYSWPQAPGNEFVPRAWPPGVLPAYAHLLLEDEWTYFVGLDGPGKRAAAVAPLLHWALHERDDKVFSRTIEQLCTVLVVLVDPGCWRVAARSEEWLRRLYEPNSARWIRPEDWGALWPLAELKQ